MQWNYLMENITGSHQLRGCNEIIEWKRCQGAINWVHFFIDYVSIPGNTNVEIFAIKVEDFTTASNKKFIHAFYILIASHYIFNLLHAMHYMLVCMCVGHPRKDETRVCMLIYTLWMYSLSTLENADKNRILFVRSPHHKHFGKAQHLVLWALWWHQLFSTR